MDLAKLIRNVPDFPVEGIQFKDITTLAKDPAAFAEAVDRMMAPFSDRNIDMVVAVESRGFIFGGPIAYRLGAGFAPVRKEGKLPADSVKATYSLEYGSDALEMHKDAIQRGQRVLIVDDLLATGGTAKATIDLVETLGGEVVGVAFLIDLTFLHGMDKLQGYEVHSVIRCDE
jgi:adenine phosphoribosyltransferase